MDTAFWTELFMACRILQIQKESIQGQCMVFWIFFSGRSKKKSLSIWPWHLTWKHLPSAIRFMKHIRGHVNRCRKNWGNRFRWSRKCSLPWASILWPEKDMRQMIFWGRLHEEARRREWKSRFFPGTETFFSLPQRKYWSAFRKLSVERQPSRTIIHSR